MKNILYIYGFGSSPESDTRKMLDELLSPHGYSVISVPYDQSAPEIGIQQLQKKIREIEPVAVIASSLGGFFAANLHLTVPVIQINPCMKPSEELPKLGVNGRAFRNLENRLSKCYRDSEFPLNHFEKVYGFFGTHDELFSYKDEFSKLFPAFDFNGGHRPTKENLRHIMPEILDCLE